MKKILIVAFIWVTTCAGAQQTENRNVGSFSGVKVAEGIDVFLKEGSKEAVKVEVTGTKLSNVITEVSGDYLKIHMAEGRYNDRTVKVYVTYVKLNKLSASSAANIFSEGTIRAKQLSISASSAGTIEVRIEADEVEASASSAAELELTGKARVFQVDVSSAGEVDAYELVADEVVAEASSGASAKVNVAKERV